MQTPSRYAAEIDAFRDLLRVAMRSKPAIRGATTVADLRALGVQSIGKGKRLTAAQIRAALREAKGMP